MSRPLVEVTVVLPMSLSGGSEGELLRFARWVERPIQGHDDSRIPALMACARGLVDAYRARRAAEACDA